MIKSRVDPFIIYFGASDVLPIHVPIASDSLFRAVEKSHVNRHTIVYEYFGERRPDATPYIFDWIGAFSYILPKFVAKYLLDYVNQFPVSKAVDVFLKDLFFGLRSQYFTVPLLTYHTKYDVNIYDSDTIGTSVPINAVIPKLKHPIVISFIIPTYNRRESLERVIDSLMEIKVEGVYIKIIVCYDPEVESIESIKEITNKLKMVRMKINPLTIHNVYNDAINDEFVKGSDFVGIWDDHTIFTNPGPIEKLMVYYDLLLKQNKNAIACFQLRLKNSFDFSYVFLTRAYLELVQYKISDCPDVLNQIKYIAMLSKINIITRDIEVEHIRSDSDTFVPITQEVYNAVSDSLLKDPVIKQKIDRSINQITSNEHYSACGLWTNIPDNWNSSDTISDTIGL
jgi:GR25 family glycosyltransferase involved in LPS biosynthesis